METKGKAIDRRKNITVNDLLVADDVNEILREFISDYAKNASSLIIIWTDREDDRLRYLSSVDQTEYLGLLEEAKIAKVFNL